MGETPANNFFHAVWIDSVPDLRKLGLMLDDKLNELAACISAFAGRHFENNVNVEPAVWNADGIRSAGFTLEGHLPETPKRKLRFPLFEIGLAADNLIAVEVVYEDNEDNDPRVVAMLAKFADSEGWLRGKLLNSFKEMARSRTPEIFIEGNHNCYINCGECCKKDSRFLASDGYCIYWTTIGGYCLPVLGARSDGRIPICENWWCTLVSRCPDGYMLEDPSLPRPHIKRLTSYSRKQKLDLLKAIEILAAGGPLLEAASHLRDDAV